jgi:hypothetical protein
VAVHACGFSRAQPEAEHHAKTASKVSARDAAQPSTQERPEQNPEESTRVLRAQLDVTRDYDQRLLATVHWSLGVSVAVVLVLITVIGIVNFRFYERDKVALRQELMGLIREDFAKSDLALRRSITDFQRDLEAQASSRHEALVKSLEQIAQASLAPVGSKIESLRSDLRDLEFNQCEAEAAQWMDKGVYSNALRAYLGMLEIALEFGSGWRASNTLGQMKSALQTILQTRRSVPDAALARDASLAIDKLPAGFSADADNLRALLQSARAL